MFKKNDIHAGHTINDSGHGGAQGVVHHANRITDGKEVAMKLMELDLGDPLKYARFKFENVILHKLSPHDNIISPVSNVAHDGSLAHYTMEYLPEDLHSFEVKLHNDIVTLQDKVDIAMGICEGLAHAHSKRIFHRDLHPQNVRIDDTSMHAKLADFGLGKVMGSYLQSETALLAWGTGVRPPEARFFTSDAPSDDYYRLGDIYALGITMHWIFSASIVNYVNAVKGDHVLYLFQRGVADPRNYRNYVASFTESQRQNFFDEWLKQLNPALGDMLRIELIEVERAKGLTEIIKKMCDPNPVNRYQTVEPIIEALKGL